MNAAAPFSPFAGTAATTSAPVLPEPVAQVRIADDIILDGRLALYHRAENWLAIADVHYGFELSQRAAGALFPLWGMAAIEERLFGLLADYRPEQLIIVGDFVHDQVARAPAIDFLGRLARGSGPAQQQTNSCEVILIAGNHDRRAFAANELRRSHQTGGYYFHHGHGPAPEDVGDRTAIIGHHHPAGILRDGAGLSLKLPAFVQNGREWVLPAFSPWAAGGCGLFGPQARLWLCTPKRILAPRV